MTRSLYGTFWLIVLFSLPLKGQDSKTALAEFFNGIRTGKNLSIPGQLSLPENAKATLSSLSPYLSDTMTVVRAKAYTLAKVAGSNSQQPSLRQQAVAILIEGCKDHDSGNVGSALGYLTSFRREDFTTAARDELVSLFKARSPHYDKLIKLIGFLELTQTQNDLRALSQQSTAAKKDRWAALLALARMGDGSAVENIVSRARKVTVNDDVVYQLFPDLVYTRQREAIDLLIEALNSDATNCMSADAERDAKIPCGYRVMEMLAPVVENYPLAVDESGDIDTNDYVNALKKVRDWFVAHPDYRIVKNRF